MIKRDDFIKIIKLRSYWKIDKRKGNYKLLNGTYLYDYIFELVTGQLNLDNLVIANDGNLYNGFGGDWNNKKKVFDDYIIYLSKVNEICTFDNQENRIKSLVKEIIGC